MLKGSDQSSDGQLLLKQLREHYGIPTHASKPPQKKLPARRATEQSQEPTKVKLLK